MCLHRDTTPSSKLASLPPERGVQQPAYGEHDTAKRERGARRDPVDAHTGGRPLPHAGAEDVGAEQVVAGGALRAEHVEASGRVVAPQPNSGRFMFCLLCPSADPVFLHGVAGWGATRRSDGVDQGS